MYETSFDLPRRCTIGEPHLSRLGNRAADPIAAAAAASAGSIWAPRAAAGAQRSPPGSLVPRVFSVGIDGEDAIAGLPAGQSIALPAHEGAWLGREESGP